MKATSILITDVGTCDFCTLLAYGLSKEEAYKKDPVKVTLNVTGPVPADKTILAGKYNQIRFGGNVEILKQMKDIVIDKNNVWNYSKIS